MRFQFTFTFILTFKIVSKGTAWGRGGRGEALLKSELPLLGRAVPGCKGALGFIAQALEFISVDPTSDLCHRPASSPVTLTDLDFSAT